MLKWAMSKIENIRKSIQEGKGSIKMIEYLLWYIECQAFILRETRLVKGTDPTETRGQLSHLAVLERVLEDIDQGHAPKERWQFVFDNYVANTSSGA